MTLLADSRRGFKLPESVLVVIHTPALEVLLIRRADSDTDFWQSVTGSKDTPEESFECTARRELSEETGFVCQDVFTPDREGVGTLRDWHLENVYAIYPRWLGRYGPGVTHNRERLFSFCMPERVDPVLNPREHTHFQWLPWQAAAEACFSPSNAEAILMLPKFVP